MKIVDFDKLSEMYWDGNSMEIHKDDIPSIPSAFEGMINGEVIQALFPHIEVKTQGVITSVKGLDCDKGSLDPYRHFWSDWWKAPYMAEIEPQKENGGYSTVTEISHRTNAASETQVERVNAIPPKIGDVYYEKHTVVGISKRTGLVSETNVEIVNVPPIEALDKIRAEIESMDFDFGDYYDHTEEIIEMVCKAIDKHKAEMELDQQVDAFDARAEQEAEYER